MLNYIWCSMIVLSFVCACFTGRLDMLAAGALDGAASAVETCIGLLGSMCLWTGLAKIAEYSGLIKVFAKSLRPLTEIIFPSLEQNSPAMRAVVMNMVANLLGMGNAATPLGISAMKELNRLNGYKSRASNEMCMFVVINTASLQLIPATVITLRQMYGSSEPSAIIVPIWVCSACAITAGIIAAKFFQRRADLT